RRDRSEAGTDSPTPWADQSPVWAGPTAPYLRNAAGTARIQGYHEVLQSSALELATAAPTAAAGPQHGPRASGEAESQSCPGQTAGGLPDRADQSRPRDGRSQSPTDLQRSRTAIAARDRPYDG